VIALSWIVLFLRQVKNVLEVTVVIKKRKTQRKRLNKRQHLQKYATNPLNRISHLNPGKMDYLLMRLRPDITSPDAVQQLFRMSQLGLTSDQKSHVFGISINRFFKELKANPTFKEADLAGKGLAIQYACQKLWDKVEEGNLGAIIFYLRTQAQWSSLEKNVVKVEDLESASREDAKNALQTLDDTDLNTLGTLLAKARLNTVQEEGASPDSVPMSGPRTIQ